MEKRGGRLNSTLSHDTTSKDHNESPLSFTTIINTFYGAGLSDSNGNFSTVNQTPLTFLNLSSNTTEGDFLDGYPYPSKYSWLHIILSSVVVTFIILVIILGNALVIVAIAKDNNLKGLQNWFIASLSVSDLLLGLFIMPFSLANELMGYWFFGEILCQMWLSIDVLLCTASILNLCLISLDRYYSITRAITYVRNRTKKRAIIMITTVWVLSGIICFPPLVGWKRPQSEKYGFPLCLLSEEPGYVVYSTLGSFFIPLFVMVIVYLKIYIAARHHARKHLKKKQIVPPQGGKQSSSSSTAKDGHSPKYKGSLEKLKLVSDSECQILNPASGNESAMISDSCNDTDRGIKMTVINNKGISKVISSIDEKRKLLCEDTDLTESEAPVEYDGHHDHFVNSDSYERNSIKAKLSVNDCNDNDTIVNVNGTGCGKEALNGDNGIQGMATADNFITNNQQMYCDDIDDTFGDAAKSNLIAPTSANNTEIIHQKTLINHNNCCHIDNSVQNMEMTPGDIINANQNKNGNSNPVIPRLDIVTTPPPGRRDIQPPNQITSPSPDFGEIGSPDSRKNLLSPNNSNNRSFQLPISSIRKSKKKRSKDRNASDDPDRQRRKIARAKERRAIIVLGIVMGTFILCWLPFFSTYVIATLGKFRLPEKVFAIMFWAGYCNSALNPIIYTIFNRDFRLAFQKIIFGRRWGG